MNDHKLRENLLEMFQGGSTHIGFEEAVKEVNPGIRNFRPKPSLHSIYEEIEHIRIAQEDIYRYTVEKGWVSPQWPEGYWPDVKGDITDEQWHSTLDRFRNDQERIIELIQDQQIDLTAEIPHGEGRTYLREILLVVDHNAYHLGKVVDIRKSLGDWYN
jgi:hypothetical protein